MSTATAATAHAGNSPSVERLDLFLTAQLLVAWAGETGEEDARRLGWWRTDLVSEFGGEALFQRLVPRTWRWAVFQAAREAGRRTDEALLSRQDSDHPKAGTVARVDRVADIAPRGLRGHEGRPFASRQFGRVGNKIH